MEHRDLLNDPAVVLALAEQVSPSLNGPSSYRLASFLEAVDADLETDDTEDIVQTLAEIAPARIAHWESVLRDLNGELVTVLDDAYPANLRMVHDHPPFLFVRGQLDLDDDRAIAVVGTRKPSDEGKKAAYQLAGELAQRGITVVSGMAAGIDTAAHRGALGARGRTIAVFGTGLNRIYPAANRGLAEAIASQGAVVSQFWPDRGSTRWTFPVRNIVTSGLAIGTVVVEAGPTSGARQQAQHALRHGKHLYLLQHLVEHQDWARQMIDLPGVIATDDVDEIAESIEQELNPRIDVLA